MEWETVIGLEVHVQLNTASKIFSGASTAFGALPNTQACAIDLGLPGVLPVLNKGAVEKAILVGLAIGSEIGMQSAFDRKNYFYPDLPKGYQISQFQHPILIGGSLTIAVDENTTKTIQITRAHLEEDAGKSLHEDFHGLSGIDLNRAGTPLLEIVSEPEMRSSKEAVLYLKALHSLVKYLDVCDGNMQEGSFRCDANVSVRKKGDPTFGTRVEIKNVNSFRFVERAIEYEVERQIETLENGGTILQETRLYDSNKNETRSMRSKEEAQDYRYFPDPDLLPLTIHADDIARIKNTMPELPQEKLNRFKEAFGLSHYDASVLTANKPVANYFEEVLSIINETHAKLAANWISSELLGALNKENKEIENSPLSAKSFAQLLSRIVDETISGKIAKIVFDAMWKEGLSADEIIESRGLKQVTDLSEIKNIVKSVIEDNLAQWNELKSGKDRLIGFFVGEVMKRSKGKANPGQVNQILKEFLETI